MDNIYVIGYRIDVRTTESDYEIRDKMVKAGLSIDGLPGEEWMIWDSTQDSGETKSIWCMKNSPFQVDYRCPIDREEIWLDLRNGESFDVPDTYTEDVAALRKTPVYEYLVDQYGDKNVSPKWGIAIMLG